MNSLTDFSSRLTPLHNGSPGLRTTMQIEIREPGKDAVPSVPNQAVLDFVSSDESLDRYNEVISAAGWKLDNYRQNPVFQNAHQYGDILHTLGKALITEVRSAHSTPDTRHSAFLFQRIEFACDVNPLARIAYGLYRGKFLNAVSVGFVPLRWKNASEKSFRNPEGINENSPGPTRNECRPGYEPRIEHSLSSAGGPRSAERSEELGHLYSGGVGNSLGRGEEAVSVRGSAPTRIFLEQELLEVSAVAIPANPNALALGLKSGAIEKSDLKDVVDLFRSTINPVRTTSPSSPNNNPASRIQNPESARLLKMLQTINKILKS